MSAMVSRMTQRRIDLIGVASGLGALDHGCQDGPEVLRSLGFLCDLDMPAGHCSWLDIVHASPEPACHPLWQVAAIAQALADRVAASLRRGHFPLVIGGDHSSAIGTWSGTHLALHEQGRLGLLWFDAHMDSHTFQTTPSQAIHGMPLACLLGQGDAYLTGIGGQGAKLHPEDVCLIGVRSYESGEATLLGKLGVRIFFMDEIRRRGLAEAFRMAWEHVTRFTQHVGISLDLDVLDPLEEAGVGSPVQGGLHREELISVLGSLREEPRLRVLEVMEYNPYRDQRFATAKAIHDLCAVVTG